MAGAECYVAVCVILLLITLIISDICIFTSNLSKIVNILQLPDHNITYDIIQYNISNKTSY